MATVLDKELKRQVTVDGIDFVVSIDPERIRLTSKGKRKPQVELRWVDLFSGEAAMAVALNASLSSMPASQPASASAPVSKRGPKKSNN